jgi:hypothetical protein
MKLLLILPCQNRWSRCWMKLESKSTLPNDQEFEEIFGFWCEVFLKNFQKLENLRCDFGNCDFLLWISYD